jgi:large subunit ribosomal protein L17
MRHRDSIRRLGRNTPHRKAMLRNAVTSLLDHEKIRSTDVKCKEIRRKAERMITLAKRGLARAKVAEAEKSMEESTDKSPHTALHARRLVAAYVRDPEIIRKLFSDIAPRYEERQGGYTRIVKLGKRSGDNAPMSVLELV